MPTMRNSQPLKKFDLEYALKPALQLPGFSLEFSCPTCGNNQILVNLWTIASRKIKVMCNCGGIVGYIELRWFGIFDERASNDYLAQHKKPDRST